MASTKTGMANLALSVVQDTPITSIDEDSDRARACKAFFDTALETVLSEHPWKWAAQRKLLSRAQDVPAFGFKYQYQLPPDSVRVFTVMKDGILVEDWDTEEDLLLSDLEGPLQVEHTVIKRNFSRMPSWLAEIVAAKLAEHISSPLKKEATDFKRAVALYKDRLADGKRKNAVAEKKTRIQTSGFEKAMTGKS